ncbi:MAG: hypothetical protein Q7J65_10025 [Candidatus Marinimicrobia bacterium]|nr:hypothetical protein [Candidatus Neomarinimicrobiota bacterium]
MKTKHILIILALFSIQLRAEKFDFDGMRYRGESVKDYKIAEKGSLVMENIRGDIKIIGEARNNIQVTERYSINAYSETDAEKIYRDYRAKYILKGNTLIIEGQDVSKRYQSDFTIQIPSNFNLDISASGGDIVTETVNGVMEIRTSGGDIDILETSGKLTVNTSGGDINIRKADADINANTSGGDITMSQISGKLYSKTSGGDISVKDFRGDGEVRSSGGDIYISHIKGKYFKGSTSGGDISIGKTSSHVRLHTSGGDIDINEVDGNLEASTSGGDIEVNRVNGYCVLSTSGGDIKIEYARDKVRATTSGGDIYLSAVSGAVYAHNSGGDIEMRKVIEKSIKDNTIDLSTSGGDIILSLPDNIKADVLAQITVYNKWDKSEIRSDFPLDISKEKRGSKLIITGRGRINGGGEAITLKTSGGDIKINRQMP